MAIELEVVLRSALKENINLEVYLVCSIGQLVVVFDLVILPLDVALLLVFSLLFVEFHLLSTGFLLIQALLERSLVLQTWSLLIVVLWGFTLSNWRGSQIALLSKLLFQYFKVFLVL